MDTEVLIPFWGLCEHREKALEFVVRTYDQPVRVTASNGKWSKGSAINPAIRESNAEILVIADADCVAVEGVQTAIEAVSEGAPWAIPHYKVVRLTEEGTRTFMRTGEYLHPFDRRPYIGFPGGGVVVARREALLRVPLDERFNGWGQEDESWALALSTMVGSPWRGESDLVHLWHPPAPKNSRRKGSPESWDLYLQYRKADRSWARMRQLLKGAA